VIDCSAADAFEVTGTMQTRKTAREGGWAGQWAFAYDDAMVEKIKAMLPPPEKRTRRTAA
jgi:hypothetical protein